MTEQNLSPVEHLKTRSRGLRGTLAEGLKNQLTGQLSADDQQLVKHHGIYQQDDRDRRSERETKKLEPAYSFMIRLRAGRQCHAGNDMGANGHERSLRFNDAMRFQDRIYRCLILCCYIQQHDVLIAG